MEEELGFKNSRTIKKKIKREPRNPLRKYSRDPDYIDKCPRAWSPDIYEFSEAEINYDDNAFDRFIPSMELRKPDIHSEFTRYLQAVPTAHQNFYQWIIDSHELSRIRTEDLSSIEEDIEDIEKRISRIGIESPKIVYRRRAFSESINRRLINIRYKFLTKCEKEQNNKIFYPTEYPSKINKITFQNAERYNMKKYANVFRNRRPNFGLVNIGFASVELVENTDYGPERFYVRSITDDSPSLPGRSFSDQCEKNMKIQSNKKPIGKMGPAIYFEPYTHKFHPVYIFNYSPYSIKMFKLETGQIESEDNPNKDHILELPTELENYIRPLVIPCRLWHTQITYSEWREFINDLKENKRIFVKYTRRGLNDGLLELVVALHKSKAENERSLDKLFCKDLLCVGACKKEKFEVKNEINEEPKARRKSSISSDNLSDIDCKG